MNYSERTKADARTALAQFKDWCTKTSQGFFIETTTDRVAADFGDGPSSRLACTALSGMRLDEIAQLRVGDCRDDTFSVTRSKSAAGVAKRRELCQCHLVINPDAPLAIFPAANPGYAEPLNEPACYAYGIGIEHNAAPGPSFANQEGVWASKPQLLHFLPHPAGHRTPARPCQLAIFLATIALAVKRRNSRALSSS
ncbi:hypothetical protein IVB14_16420 [Bradyrhizobium sp. 180]|uniref:hypothetical protein n=1 Tax=Bradyrhizobium sp. 180 TaxID=2782650 RepID=UPI001FF95DC4|nr:hypothetical protein [Bradyrhizobium sp. 180]MCK1491964.1 hypothetical protein [Bradyrhizobium sp. 180]